ncbi:MAG: hypothetical protein LAT82_03235 [Nanoarchaeota archaeon]|nr:hypothetical protein [Nanoarchaeota archaeon]
MEKNTKTKMLGGLVGLTIALSSPSHAQGTSFLDRNDLSSQDRESYEIGIDNLNNTFVGCWTNHIQPLHSRGEVPRDVLTYLISVQEGLRTERFPSYDESESFRNFANSLPSTNESARNSCSRIPDTINGVIVPRQIKYGHINYPNCHSTLRCSYESSDNQQN